MLPGGISSASVPFAGHEQHQCPVLYRVGASMAPGGSLTAQLGCVPLTARLLSDCILTRDNERSCWGGFWEPTPAGPMKAFLHIDLGVHGRDQVHVSGTGS